MAPGAKTESAKNSAPGSCTVATLTSVDLANSKYPATQEAVAKWRGGESAKIRNGQANREAVIDAGQVALNIATDVAATATPNPLGSFAVELGGTAATAGAANGLKYVTAEKVRDCNNLVDQEAARANAFLDGARRNYLANGPTLSKEQRIAYLAESYMIEQRYQQAVRNAQLEYELKKVGVSESRKVAQTLSNSASGVAKESAAVSAVIGGVSIAGKVAIVNSYSNALAEAEKARGRAIQNLDTDRMSPEKLAKLFGEQTKDPKYELAIRNARIEADISQDPLRSVTPASKAERPGLVISLQILADERRKVEGARIQGLADAKRTLAGEILGVQAVASGINIRSGLLQSFLPDLERSFKYLGQAERAGFATAGTIGAIRKYYDCLSNIESDYALKDLRLREDEARVMTRLRSAVSPDVFRELDQMRQQRKLDALARANGYESDYNAKDAVSGTLLDTGSRLAGGVKLKPSMPFKKGIIMRLVGHSIGAAATGKGLLMKFDAESNRISSEQQSEISLADARRDAMIDFSKTLEGRFKP